MKKINYWEIESAKEYTILNTIEEVLEAIKAGRITLNFSKKSNFTPGDKIEFFLESKAAEDNFSLTYTDENHNVYISNNSILPTIINPSFLKKYEKEIRQAFFDQIKVNNDPYLTITNFVFTDELFDFLLTKKETNLYFKNITLSKEQIKKLQDNFIQAFLLTDEGNKQISSEFAIDYYTPELLSEMNEISILFETFEQAEMKNLRFLPDQAVIDILLLDFESLKEEDRLLLLKEKLLELDKLKKHFVVKFNVQKRSIFKSIFQDLSLKNLSLVIKNDLFDYPYEQYLEEEQKLEDLIKPMKEAPLSPLEKYLAIYNLVKNFKPYKENQKDNKQARYLRYILDNEYMVCVGYAKLLVELLDKVGLNSYKIGVDVDTSYDDGFTLEEKIVSYGGHARVVVSMDDDKYNLHGIFMADPTWDNSVRDNYLNHALMPFDKMQISKRMFFYNSSIVILDIHNFEEFNDQVNFLLKRELKEQMAIKGKNDSSKLLTAYESVCKQILNSIQCDPKYEEFHEMKKTLKTEKEYENFLTLLGHYLLTRINQPVNEESLLKASIETVKKTKGLKEEEIETLDQDTRREYARRENINFPYQIPKDNNFNLETKKSSR